MECPRGDHGKLSESISYGIRVANCRICGYEGYPGYVAPKRGSTHENMSPKLKRERYERIKALVQKGRTNDQIMDITGLTHHHIGGLAKRARKELGMVTV